MDRENLKTPATVLTLELEDREIIINDNHANKQKRFTTNHIRTAKYNIFTFVPIGLLV